jgi:hypothetical protein
MIEKNNSGFRNRTTEQLSRDDFLGFTIKEGPLPYALPLEPDSDKLQDGFLCLTKEQGLWFIIPPKYKLPVSDEGYEINNRIGKKLRSRQRFHSIPNYEEEHRRNLYFMRVNWQRLITLFTDEQNQREIKHAPGYIEVTLNDRFININDADNSGRRPGRRNCGKPDFIGFIPAEGQNGVANRAVIVEFSKSTKSKYGQVARHTVGLEDFLKQTNLTIPIEHYVCTYSESSGYNILAIHDPKPDVVASIRKYPVEKVVFNNNLNNYH